MHVQLTRIIHPFQVYFEIISRSLLSSFRDLHRVLSRSFFFQSLSSSSFRDLHRVFLWSLRVPFQVISSSNFFLSISFVTIRFQFTFTSRSILVRLNSGSFQVHFRFNYSSIQVYSFRDQFAIRLEIMMLTTFGLNWSYLLPTKWHRPMDWSYIGPKELPWTLPLPPLPRE